MLIALIVVAVLAIGLAAALLMTRASAAEFRTQAEARESALQAERTALTEANAAAGRELAGARAQIDELKADLTTKAATVRSLRGDIDKASTVAAEQSARIEQQSSEITALVTDNNALQVRLDAAEASTAEARAATATAEAAEVEARDRAATAEAEVAEVGARLAEAERRADEAEIRSRGIVVGDVGIDAGDQPEALWSLEVARSERTWRNSVAVDPNAPHSPFETADDPVRLAVEIEAAALRENVGASIEVDWRAAAVDEPARRHLILRVAQELLEAAARNPEPTRLVARGDEAVTLELQPAEDGDNVINIVPPQVTSDLIDVKQEAGLSITVKAN